MTRRIPTIAMAVTALAVLGAPAESMAARSLSIEDATRAEPPGRGTAAMTLDVTLSKANPKRAVKAEFNTSPGSANSLDYRPTFGTVKVPAGETKAEISVPVRGDLFAEPAETFTVKLSNPKRASIDDGEAEGLIPANDNGPDADGDDIPDADDCAPSDPNPEGQLECFVPTTIYGVNAGALPPGTRAYIPNALITARSDNGRTAYGQILSGDPGYVDQDFSALELRTGGIFLQPEQRQTLLGIVRAGYFQVTGIADDVCCESVPAPIVLTPAALAADPEELNGQLVEITNVSIESVSAGRWLLVEDVAVTNELFLNLPAFEPGSDFETIRGHADTAGAGTPGIEPRSLDDIDPEFAKLTAFVTADTCLAPGEQDVHVGSIQIDEAQATDTVIDLDDRNEGVVTVPATVTIPAGETSAPVFADAVGEDGDSTELEAKLFPIEESIFVDISQGC